MSCTAPKTGAGSEMAVIIEPEARRRAGGFLSRFPRANPKKCDRLFGVVARFVLQSKRTDFGGRGLPEFPMISIIQPTCRNCLICKRISQECLILTPYIDYSVDMLQHLNR
jgi:hypothetical protein